MRTAALMIVAAAMAVAAVEPPAWTARGVSESETHVLAVGIAVHTDVAEGRRQAEAGGRARLAEYHGTQVETDQVLTMVMTNAEVQEQLKERIATRAQVVLRRSAGTQQFWERKLADGSSECYALVGIRIGDLFPERKLREALALPADKKLPALRAQAETFETEGYPVLAELAWLHALQVPGAGCAESLGLAWFAHRRGDDVTALRYVEVAATEAGTDEQRQSIARLQAVLKAGLQHVPDACRELARVTAAARNQELFDVQVQKQAGATFLLVWKVQREQRRLLLLWDDGEDFAVVDTGTAGAQAFLGTAETVLQLAPGGRAADLHAWALAAEDPVWHTVDQLGNRSIPIRNDAPQADRIVLRDLLTNLRRASRPGVAQPASAWTTRIQP